MRPTADFQQEYDRRKKKKRKQLVFAWLKKKKRGRHPHQPDAKQIGDAPIMTDRESQENRLVVDQLEERSGSPGWDLTAPLY